MLQLKPTEHLTGINLSGDYQDLNALRSAIFRVCGDENEYDGYESAQTYLLALCYDLRHAYMGDRGYLSVDNGSDCMGDAIRCIFDFGPDDDIEEMKKRYTNGNLYFHENLVFPDAVYFTLVLDEFLLLTETKLLSDWQPDSDCEPYDIYQFQCDKALIQYYQSCVWKCLQSVIGSDRCGKIKKAIGRKRTIFQNYATPYLEQQSTLYLSIKSTEDKPDVLARIIYQIIKKPADYCRLELEMMDYAREYGVAPENVNFDFSYLGEVGVVEW